MVTPTSQHNQIGSSDAGLRTLLCPDCIGDWVKKQRFATSGENRDKERKDAKWCISESES